MTKKKKRKISRKLLYIDKDYKTRAIQNPKTGKMRGRKRVSGRGDSTAVYRVKSGPRKGQIMGRTTPIKVRASKKARAHLRRRL